MHTCFLGVKSGMKIVDVGCGTGDFTRYLASLVPGKSTIIGVDARAASLRSAEKETARVRIGARISYRKEEAYKIPIEDGWQT
jgi:ubiquinone/menaquinone biosynthesis C-methylase UbiE